VTVDACKHSGSDQDLPARVVLASAAILKGARPGVDALLPDFELLQFGFERADAFVEFGHVAPPLIVVQSLGVRVDRARARGFITRRR
jgi:hypothetical protein